MRYAALLLDNRVSLVTVAFQCVWIIISKAAFTQLIDGSVNGTSHISKYIPTQCYIEHITRIVYLPKRELSYQKIEGLKFEIW